MALSRTERGIRGRPALRAGPSPRRRAYYTKPHSLCLSVCTIRPRDLRPSSWAANCRGRSSGCPRWASTIDLPPRGSKGNGQEEHDGPLKRPCSYGVGVDSCGTCLPLSPTWSVKVLAEGILSAKGASGPRFGWPTTTKHLCRPLGHASRARHPPPQQIQDTTVPTWTSRADSGAEEVHRLRASGAK